MRTSSINHIWKNRAHPEVGVNEQMNTGEEKKKKGARNREVSLLREAF